MGILSTYGELKTAITDYSGRGGNATYVANLPLFVRRAHDAILRELDIPQLQESADFTINAERMAIPTGFLSVKRLFLNADYDSPLSPTSLELRVREAVKYTSGRPRVFCREGAFLAFGPIPDTTYTGKLLYKKGPTFFASDSAGNDILTAYPFLYLNGALAEAARFDKADEDIALYEALFRDEIDSINHAERRNAQDGGVMLPSPSGGVV